MYSHIYLQEAYTDEADQWIVILAAVASKVCFTCHRTKGKSPSHLVFGRDMILPINHAADLGYICQRKQAQIDKYAIHENTTIIDHYYIVRDKVTTKTKSEYNHKNLFKGLYEICHTWTNVTVTLKTGVVATRINIRNLMPYNNSIIEG